MRLLAAAVIVLLVIGMANVANLMLVEATARRREMALRAAVGASRFRIFRHLVVEGVLLALGGGALGIVLAAATVKTVARAAVDYVPRADQIAIDGRVLTFAVLLSGFTGLVFALSPALLASRADVQQDLREGARGAVGGSRTLRSAFVVVQFAAAVVLVIGAGLLLRSFWNILRVQPGYSSDHVIVATVELPRKYDNAAAITQFYGDLLTRLGGRGGIRAAGIVNNLPVSGSSWTALLTIENVARPDSEPPDVGHRAASPGYFGALRIPVVDGRGLADSDTPESLKVAVVNHALASRFFPRGGAVGARIRIGRNPKAPWRTIVGVVGDVHHDDVAGPPRPALYTPQTQFTDSFLVALIKVASADPMSVAVPARQVIRSMDPNVPVYRVATLPALVAKASGERMFVMRLLAGFAFVAVLLAAIGLYGVVSYGVALRTREVGLRMALGAQRVDVLRLVLAGGAKLVGLGVVAGLGGAAASTRLMHTLVFGVSPIDPLTFAVAVLVLVLVALLAHWIPVRRALRIDPALALRAE
jgi:predicted permease